MYRDDSTTSTYPKTILIRNHEGGMIWQVYHVRNEKEAIGLMNGATKNGFMDITLEDHQPEMEETVLGWRMSASKDIVGENFVPTAEDIIDNEKRIKRELEDEDDLNPYQD